MRTNVEKLSGREIQVLGLDYAGKKQSPDCD